MKRAAFVVLLLLGYALPYAAQRPAVLASETFEDLPLGFFSNAAAAIYEYHYIAPARPLGRWEDAVIMSGRDRCWLIAEENGNHVMEQTVVNEAGRKWTSPMVVTGDPEWSDYTVEARVRPLSTRDMAGIVFRYANNRNHYLFALDSGKRLVLLRREEESAFHQGRWITLGEAAFPHTTDDYYSLRVVNSGPQIRCYAGEKLMIEASDNTIARGRVALLANVPARFDDVRVTTTPENAKAITSRIAARDAELKRLRVTNPGFKLWKKFETPDFGVGRAVRFGDLDGDGHADAVFAQNVPRVRGDAYDMISCLTAITLDGRVLWQIGKPSPDNGLLTNDLPVQIHDIDGDGKNEVIYIKDFRIQVVDGATGKLKYQAWTPPAGKENAFDRTHGDSLAFANVSGNSTARDLIVKDRYATFWVFDSKLKQLWSGECKTGHYPFPYDVDGDGRDEIFIGYSLYSRDGRRLWTLDKQLGDHADGIAAGKFAADPAAPARVIVGASDEGFLILDTEGKILHHIRLGHGQSPSVGKFRPDLPGLQVAVVNFWNNPGIVTILDMEGNTLAKLEPLHVGSPMLPVNWTGDGQELIFLNGDPKEGGLLDGWGRRAAMFPDDGHPVLCGTVMNLTGDERDEIVLWDQKRMWIYTQDRPFAGKRIYAPRRNPDYNESNYRTNVSLPGWRDVAGASQRR